MSAANEKTIVPPKSPEVHPAVAKLADFSEKWSPVLVKELRQGLRTNTFSILFLVLQAILMLVVFSVASTDFRSESAGRGLSTSLFVLYSLAALIIQPLRGVAALSKEIKGKTIDLLVLTRLSSWRIVFGKWTSIFAQTLLLLCTLIPYFIMRYFFGGMQLFSELLLVLTITFISGVFTAVAVGLSGNKSAIVRTMIPGLAAFFTSTSILGFFFAGGVNELLQFFTFEDSDSLLIYGGFLVCSLYFGYYFLEIGAEAIAPPAENRSTRKRLISFVVLIVGVLPLAYANLDAALFAGLVLFTFMAVVTLSERGEFPTSICRPFLRFGILGRIAGRFLYPGWYTGILYLLMIAVPIFMIIYWQNNSSSLSSYSINKQPAEWCTSLMFTGQALFPAVIVRLFFRNHRNPLSVYIGVYILSFIVAFMLATYADFGENTLTWIFSFIPITQLYFFGQDWPEAETSLALLGAFNLAYLSIILFFAIAPLRALRKIENDAVKSSSVS